MKQVIVVRKDLKLGKGKLSAQVAHASLNAYKEAERKKPEWVKEWEFTGQKKVVLKVEDEAELINIYNIVKKKFPCALIRDAGRTQTAPGTITCIGIGPVPEGEIDKITGNLKLVN
jgi:PTH2 family peptidyl-tRNA hydrolase